jgi:superfamily II DNA or RNA helicase
MKLRSYQVTLNQPAEAFLKSNKATRAQVYAPTGSGKTVCFMSLIKKAIADGKRNIAIIHPRIALSQDQLKRFKNNFGTTVRFTSFHSGQHIAGKETIREVSTTEPTKLQNRIDGAAADGVAHITFSSYHSFDKLVSFKFDIVICDESHYLVQDQFYSYVPQIQAAKILFYTATPITKDMEDTTMDLSVFGDVIAQVEPSVLIKPGYIVAPMIQLLEVITDKRSDIVDPVDVVARAYVEQYKEITAKGMPFVQMLVATRGVASDIDEIESNLKELWDTIKTLSNGAINQVDVYTIAADRANCNGRPMPSRDAALQQLKDSNANAILVHYDTLSEGVDIDTLTGACIMRKMSKAKLLQTIGRCARPYKGDLTTQAEPNPALYDFDKGIDFRKKPRCIITLPVVDGTSISNDDGTIMAEAFIAGGYGDLLTYMQPTDDDAKGKSKTTFDLGENDTVLANVIEHAVHREVEDMRKLFEFV